MPDPARRATYSEHEPRRAASDASCTLRRARPLLGTLVEIAATGDSAAAVGAAIAQAFDAVEAVQRAMSYHDPASDVSRLNRSGAGTLRVDPQTWHVLDTARALSAASNGIFDVCVAPTLVRQGYLPDHADFPRPARDARWHDLELLPETRVRLARPLQIDLGGIAKGHAVDRALRVLQQAGMRTGRVNAGGDLRLFGTTAETIHVRDPHDPTAVLPLCSLREGAVATSARYFNAVSDDTASPLIDARSRDVCGHAYSVSVLADDCIVADALTKVVFADPTAALPVLQQFGAEAVIVERVIVETAPDARALTLRRSGPQGWQALAEFAAHEASA